jgi:hypothetical protein
MDFQNLFNLLTELLSLYNSYSADFLFISDNVISTPTHIASLRKELTTKSLKATELSLRYNKIQKDYNNSDANLLILNDETKKFVITNLTLASSLLELANKAPFATVIKTSSGIEISEINKVLYGKIASLLNSTDKSDAINIVNNIDKQNPVFLQNQSIIISTLGCLLALKSCKSTEFNQCLSNTAQASAAALDNNLIKHF